MLSFQQSVTRIHTRTRHCAHNAQLREPHFRQAALRPKKLKSANTTRCQRIDVIHLEYACLGEHRTTAGVIVQASHATCKRALLSVFITTDPPAGTHMEASRPRWVQLKGESRSERTELLAGSILSPSGRRGVVLEPRLEKALAVTLSQSYC